MKEYTPHMTKTSDFKIFACLFRQISKTPVESVNQYLLIYRNFTHSQIADFRCNLIGETLL